MACVVAVSPSCSKSALAEQAVSCIQPSTTAAGLCCVVLRALWLPLQGPFSSVVDRHVSDPWLKSLMDLECFVLSGMLAKDTLTAEMAFMFMERSQGRNRINYPVSLYSKTTWSE